MRIRCSSINQCFCVLQVRELSMRVDEVEEEREVERAARVRHRDKFVSKLSRVRKKVFYNYDIGEMRIYIFSASNEIHFMSSSNVRNHFMMTLIFFLGGVYI